MQTTTQHAIALIFSVLLVTATLTPAVFASPTGEVTRLDHVDGFSQASVDTESETNQTGSVEITDRSDPPHNGTINYTVHGEVFGAPDSVTNVTISVNGNELQTPLVSNNTSGVDEFAANVTLDEQVNVIEVTARVGPNASQIVNDTLRLDGDGLSDTFEEDVVGMNPLNPDSDAVQTAANESNNSIIDGAEDLDNDTVATYYETFFETDPLNADTDGDNLSDGFESQYSVVAPLTSDSDGDNESDATEDPDSDGLSNLREQEVGSGPQLNDTDFDGLNDSEEIDVHSTEPLNPDSDNDGLLDGEEITLGTDPLTNDSDGDGVADGNESYTTTARNESLDVIVTVTGTGNAASGVTITNSSHPKFQTKAIHNASVSPIIEVDVDQENVTGTVTLSYNESALSGGDEADLSIYQYNESQRTFLKSDSTVNEVNNTVSTDTTNFSAYVVLNQTTWENSVRLGVPMPIPDSSTASTSSMSVSTTSTNDPQPSAPADEPKWVYPQYTDNFNDNDISDWGTLEGPVPGGEGGFIRPIKNGYVGARSGQLELYTYGCYKTVAVKNIGPWNGTARISYDWTRQSDDNYHETHFLIGDNYTVVDYDVISGRDIPQYEEGRETSSSPTFEAQINESLQIQFLIQPGYKYRAHTDSCKFARYGTTLQIDNIVVSEVVTGPNDTDRDGLPNILEEGKIPIGSGGYVKTNPNVSDTDGDGLLDGEEIRVDREVLVNPDTGRKHFQTVSDPTDPDTDDDGLGDYEEVRGSYEIAFTASPEDTRAFLAALTDNSTDPSSVLTYRNATSDAREPDTDDDGLSDLTEVRLGTDASRADTDGDSIEDSEEKTYGADPTLFDAQPPEINIRTASYYKKQFSFDVTYTLGFDVSDASGIKRVTVADDDVRFEDEPGLVYAKSYNTQFKTGALDTSIDSLTGTAVDITASDRHDNVEKVRAIQRTNTYGTIAGQLGANTIYTRELAQSLGVLSGFGYGIGGIGETADAFADDPIGSVTAILEIVTLIENAGVLDDLIASLPERIERQQRLNNPYNPETNPQLYQEYRRGWYGGYAAFFVTETIVSGGAARAVKSSERLTDAVETIKRSDRLEGVLDTLKSADTLSPTEQTRAYGITVLTDGGYDLDTSKDISNALTYGAQRAQVIKRFKEIEPVKHQAISGNERATVRLFVRTGDDGVELINDIDADSAEKLLAFNVGDADGMRRKLAKYATSGKLSVTRTEQFISDIYELREVNGLANGPIKDISRAGQFSDIRGAMFEVRVASIRGGDNIQSMSVIYIDSNTQKKREIDIVTNDGDYIEVKGGNFRQISEGSNEYNRFKRQIKALINERDSSSQTVEVVFRDNLNNVDEDILALIDKFDRKFGNVKASTAATSE